MRREDIDKRIGMPDVDAEWARFEREVIGKERPKRRLVAAWAAGIGIAAAIALLLVLNMGKEGSADMPLMAQQAEEQHQVSHQTEEQPLVAQLTDKQPTPLQAGEPTPAQVARPESSNRQIKAVPTRPSTEETNMFDCGEISPRYPGGDKALAEFINENLRYPDLALEYGAKGRVIIGFVVDSVGLVSDFKVMKNLLRYDTLRLHQESMARQEEIIRLMDGQMQEEALRVVSLLRQQPRWSPGEQFGRRVSVRMYLPVRFQPTKQMIAAYESGKHLQERIAGQEVVPTSAGLGPGHPIRITGSDSIRHNDSIIVILNGTIQSASVRSELVVSPHVYIYKQHQMIDSIMFYSDDSERKRFESTYGFPPPRLGFREIAAIPDTLSEAYMQQHPEKRPFRRRIEGFVQSEDGKPLADAWISCDAWNMGAATDSTGRFMMWAPRTIAKLNAQRVGYRQIRNIQPADSIIIIRMKDATKLREVKVQPKKKLEK